MKKDSNMFNDNSTETEGVPADKTAEIPKVEDSTEEENAKKPLMLFGREFSRKQVCVAGAGILCAALLIGGGGYAITHADWTGKANAPAVSQSKDDEEQDMVLSLEVKADGWDTETSTPVIAHIEDEDGKVDFYTAIAANKQVTVKVGESGTYTVTFISPVNADGSIYKVPSKKVTAGKRRVLLLFRYGRFKVQVASVELFLKGFQRMPLEQMLLTGKQLLSRQILEGEFSGIRITACKQLVELSGDVVGDGFVAFHHKPQRRGLHASDGEQAVKTLGGESRLVHAEAHIRHLSGIGGVPGTTAGVVGHELVECLHDILLDVVVHVDALDLTGVAEVVQKLVHDKLPLIVRVTGGDDGIASFKESRNLVDEGLLALSGLLIDRRFLRPVVNLDREYIKAPRHSPFWVDGIRFYQFQKVAGAGTDRVAVSRDGKAGAFGHLFSRDGAGDIAGEHRLFRDD